MACLDAGQIEVWLEGKTLRDGYVLKRTQRGKDVLREAPGKRT